MSSASHPAHHQHSRLGMAGSTEMSVPGTGPETYGTASASATLQGSDYNPFAYSPVTGSPAASVEATYTGDTDCLPLASPSPSVEINTVKRGVLQNGRQGKKDSTHIHTRKTITTRSGMAGSEGRETKYKNKHSSSTHITTDANGNRVKTVTRKSEHSRKTIDSTGR